MSTPPAPPQHPQHPQPQYPQQNPAVVYLQAPAQKYGLLKMMFGAIGRMILTLIVVFVIMAIFGALIMTAMQPQAMVYRSGSGSKQVAVIDINGTIDDDMADYVRNAVNQVLDNPKYATVVLRVDSPGGGVTASDQIWYQIKRLQQQGKPVVASYGSVAASGGYYISCRSDFIFAEPTTITGSIGVIMQAMTFADLLEKVGINPVTLVAEGSPAKNIANDLYRDWNDQDKEKIQKVLNQAYDVFFERVAERRQDIVGDEYKLRAIADGSIYTANEAQENGLIDQIGYLDDAVDYAIKSAGLPSDTQVMMIQKLQGPFDGLPRLQTLLPAGSLSSASNKSQNNAGSNYIDSQSIRLLIYELTRPMAMYLMN